MKIKYMSDLHLEGGYDLDVSNDDNCDLLILAGDICTHKSIESCDWFFQRCSERFPDVVYVNGNHEFYRGDIEETPAVINHHIEKYKNIHYLNNQLTSVSGYHIWGGTLWTDCNQGDPLTKIYLKNHMNDYFLIKWKSREHWKLRPEDTEELHHQAKKELIRYLQVHGDEKPNIIVTHMAPSKRSLHPRYVNDYYMNGGYSSDLEQMMLDYDIPLWFHGHTHDSFDYNVFGKTRVLTNPRGYMYPGRDGKRYPENENFDPNKVVEI